MLDTIEIEPIIQLRKKLHNSPEASMNEVNTKRTLMDFIRAHTHSLEVVDMGAWFYAVKVGESHGCSIAFRADYDAVVCADGICRHLCGHDGHSAILAGFSLWLDAIIPRRDVYLIFQPGEEVGKGAQLCSSLIEKADIAEIYGFHNIPSYEKNEALLLDRTFACASTGLEITLTGRQSHAAYPESGINPSAAIADIIRYMNDVIDEKHKGIVLGTVIGIEAGSRSYGVSAGDGVLRLTLRAEYQDEYDDFTAKIEARAKDVSAAAKLSYKITRIEEFPATINDKTCVDRVRRAAERLGLKTAYPEAPFRWSEDFGYYLQKTKGAFIGIGCGENHAALHTMEYEFEDDIIGTVIGLYREMI